MPDRSGNCKKLLSLLLAFCLLASLLPAVSAEGRETPFVAKIQAGTVFYADQDLKNETGTLNQDAVVLVTEEKGKADHITYKLEGQKARSWIRKDAANVIAATPTDLSPYIPDENLTLTPPAVQEETPDAPAEEQPTEDIPSEIDPSDIPADSSVVPVEEGETPETPPEPSADPQEQPINEDPTISDVIPTVGEGEPSTADSVGNPVEGEDIGNEQSPGDGAATVDDAGSPDTLTDQPVEEDPTGENPSVLPTDAESAESPSTPTDLPAEGSYHATGHIDGETWEELVRQETAETPDESAASGDDSLSGLVWTEVDGELIVTAYIPHFYNVGNEIGSDGIDSLTLPAVRNQNPYGTCWAFAAVGGMEIDLIKDGNANAATINLSELFLAYYLAHNYSYPKGGMGDDEIWTEMYDSTYSYLDIGGNSTLAVRILSSLIGTTTEADNPYQDKEPSSFVIAAQMTGAYTVRATEKTEIKQLIRDHGAVDASIWMPTGTTVPSGYYSGFSGSGKTRCLYGNYPYTNHDILLVGWDDNFPVSNFTGTRKPSGPGAWLVRNSWGAQGYSDYGYFWISYEDVSLTRGTVTAFDAENRTDQMDNNAYSYDHSPYPNGVVIVSESTATLVQNYTIHGYETVTAVGVETDLNNPDDRLDLSVKVSGGGKTATGSRTNVGEGFFRIPVGSGLSFTVDTVVTVEVTYKARKSGMIIRVPYEREGGISLGGDIGEYNFYGSQDGGGWTLNGRSQKGDPRVKVYTRDAAGAVKVTGISLNKTSVTNARITDPIQLTATVSPSNASNKHVSWTSSDTNVATVDQNGKVTLWAGGEAVITATTASGGKKATCKITVPVEKPTGIKINGYGTGTFTINNANAGSFWIGSTMNVKVNFTPSYATERDVTWTSSNPKVLAVDNVYADGSATFLCRGNGSTTIRVESSSNPNLYDQRTIIIDLHRQVSSVSLDRTSNSIPVGGNFRLYPTVSPSDADNKNVIWSSSNANVASVDAYGNVYGQYWGTATITVTTVDGAKTATCVVTVTPRDLVEAFVFRMYKICLQRDPDAGGFSYWVDQLNSGKKTGAEAVFNFYESNEMKNRALPNDQYLARLYEGIMGRAPDAGGYSYWMEMMNAGMSRPYVISGFLTSKEFDNICRSYGINKGSYSSSEPRDKNLGITGFVSRLYTKLLGRSFDDVGLNYWCGIVLKNPVRATLLKVALDGFLHSNEFINMHLNDTQYLQVLYRAFLDREADAGGMSYWLGQMGSGMSRDKVAEGFAGSNEFKNIMARYGFTK